MTLSLEQAKALMTVESSEKLRHVVDNTITTIDFSNKVNKDIIMGAMCRAVESGLIRINDLDDKLIKLLNSDTNTMSYSKLIYALNTIHATNPRIVCEISIYKPASPKARLVRLWNIYDNKTTFNDIFEFVLKEFNISPHDIRVEMTKTLKPTVVNNVAQLAANFLKSNKEERKKIIISIVAITRLVNMSNHLIYANFKKLKDGTHDSGIGWNPLGVWHGECTKSTCKGCPYEFDTEDPFDETLQGKIKVEKKPLEDIVEEKDVE